MHAFGTAVRFALSSKFSLFHGLHIALGYSGLTLKDIHVVELVLALSAIISLCLLLTQHLLALLLLEVVILVGLTVLQVGCLLALCLSKVVIVITLTLIKRMVFFILSAFICISIHLTLNLHFRLIEFAFMTCLLQFISKLMIHRIIGNKEVCYLLG